MKRLILLAVGLLIVMGITFAPQQLKAQVYSEFYAPVTIDYSYQPITDGTVIFAQEFGLPPTYPIDRDNGYRKIDIGFPFEFNGEVFTSLWICVNGFVTFSQPPLVPAIDPDALFIEANSYPKNVIAPYWGNHYYRTDEDNANLGPDDDKWMASEISYKVVKDNQNEPLYLIIQWKNLNINDASVTSSVGNFQVRLFKSTDDLSSQGNIEFHYGQVGGNPNTEDTRIITKNASCGIKGESSDFINALEFNKTMNEARTLQTKTDQWKPSSRDIWAIKLGAITRYNIEEWWGDGDADFSKGKGQRHENLGQNRFVTINDARIIMKSVATATPLDSVRRRAAYHGDVDHNGRFWYNNDGVRKDISFRDINYADNLDKVGVSSIKRVFYQVNEYDAALILHYLAARLPQLPWIYDTIPMYGKIAADELANSIVVTDAQKIGDNLFTFPVYPNGTVNGAMSVFFKVNGTIKDVKNENENLMIDYNNNLLVVSGTTKLTKETPICYVTVKADKNQIDLTNVRFNAEKRNDITIEELSNSNEPLEQNVPNPFITSVGTTIKYNITTDGYYNLSIYDLNGNLIKTLVNDNIKAGSYSINWNGLDQTGESVNQGMYIYKLTSDNLSITKKLVVVK